MGLFSSIVGAVAGPVIGGLIGGKNQEKANDQNAELQREFAQNSIQWKVADAKAAGINPVYALGAQTSPAMASFQAPDTSWISEAGQGLARASEAGQTNMQRLQERLLSAQIDGQEIENAGKRAQIALTSGALRNPPFPSGMISGEVLPSYDTVMTANGPRRIMSSSIGDIVTEDPIEYAKFYGRQWADGFRSGTSNIARRLYSSMPKGLFRKGVN